MCRNPGGGVLESFQEEVVPRLRPERGIGSGRDGSIQGSGEGEVEPSRGRERSGVGEGAGGG